MVKLNYWNIFNLFLGIVLSVARAVLQDGEGCQGSHKEVVFPRLISRHGLSNLTAVTLKLRWRQEMINVALEAHKIAPGGAVSEWHEEGNRTEVEALNDDTVHYQGRVLGTRFSFVALSLSNDGLTGFIQIDNEGVFIEPMPHAIRRGLNLGSHVMKSCGKAQPLPHDVHKRNTGNRPRRVRGAYTKYLEVLLVADSTVTDFVGQRNIKKYLLTLMNIVNTVYHHDSLGVAIEVVTVKIKYMDKTTEKRVISLRDPKRTVDQFCYWASTSAYRPSNSYDQTTNHDVAVLLTRHNFAPAGYAPITGLCVPMRNCAFVKDAGFTSAFVIAHEVAHVFGLNHDGQGNTCYGQEYTNSIMATMVKSSFNHYWWSGCSRNKMAAVINNLPCLNNNPLSVINDVPLSDPLGQDWTLDEQCRLEFGQGFRRCAMFAQQMCTQMWCSDDPYSYRCTTKNVVPLEGTQCGYTPQWYCKAGACSYHGDQPPIHGGWSKWTAWSECSAGCGIGFKRRSRSCNAPKPQYNGKECDGESENTDICKAEVCGKFEDMRASQCRLMDIVPFKGKIHQWLPYQVDRVEDQCKLSCKSVTTREVVTFDTLVDNSTPCTYGDSTDICMDGTCVKVGCDAVPDSNMKVDKCGVCEGTGGTCKTVSGRYEHTFDYSAANGNYEMIINIPKGARDIVIDELQAAPHFISLQDHVYHRRYLNGDKRQESSKKFVMEGAWFNYVNHYGKETIKTNGPLHGNISVLLYPQSSRKPASLQFSYTIDNADFTYEASKFEWRFGDWSTCSVTCGKGTQYIVYTCYNKHIASFVDDELCVHSTPKTSDEIECERIDCESVQYTWRMLRKFSSCSESCGDGGLSHQLYECERLADGEKMDNVYCNYAPAPIHLEPCNRKPCVESTYRWKVTTSWSACSVTCGSSGTQHQLFYCVKEGDGDVKRVTDAFCADLTSPMEPRPCNRIPCVSYRWVPTEDWGECSQKCGQDGVQQRKAMCKQFNGETARSVVGSWNCDAESLDAESRPCNVRDCFSFKWVSGEEWGECSHTCGTDGLKLKDVFCYNVTYDNRERKVDGVNCDMDTRPEISEQCNIIRCADFRWEYAEQWTNCSSECGDNGTQTQVQNCVSEITDDADVSDADCEGIPSLEEKFQSCNTIPCLRWEWRVLSEWVPACPNYCDEDFSVEQTRQVVCLEISFSGGEQQTEDSLCAEAQNLTRPVSLRGCNASTCEETVTWSQTEEWSECSVTCGNNGVQTRRLRCDVTVPGNVSKATDPSKCSQLPVPEAENRPCEFEPCIRLHDDPEAPWSACSRSCGPGVQQRETVCYTTLEDGEEESVDMSVCVRANLTATERPCDLGPCSYLEYGVGPWSGCSKTCGPGKMKRIVYCGDSRRPSSFSQCPGKAPDEYGNCNIKPCAAEQTTTSPSTTRRRGCTDRASFCSRASATMCQHRTYARVCCKSCNRLKRRRRHWNRFRRVRHGRHVVRG